MSEFDQPVASHMVAPVRTLLPTERLTGAARALEEFGVSALPIVDHNGRLLGVLERSDLLRSARLQHAPEEGGAPSWWWPDLSISECMQTSVPICGPAQTLRECAQRMLDRRLNRIYVLAGDDLVGVISTRELMRAVAREGLVTTIREFAAGVAEGISAAAPLSAASARFLACSGQPLVVLEGSSPVGIFAQPELRACLEADPGWATRLFMDERVLTLPADLPVHHAAAQAVAAGARYIIAQDPVHGFRVLAGASFAACVAGKAASEARSVPAVTLADPAFRAAPIALPDRAPAPAASPLSDFREQGADEPRRRPPAVESSAVRPREPGSEGD